MKKLALVDDSSFSRKQLAAILREHFGPEAELVHFPQSAEAARQIPQGNFDAVFLDLVMPAPDGFAVLEHLRKAGYQKPVIVCTADIQATSKQRCEQLGATAYVEKPFSKAKVLACLQQLAL